MDPIPVHPLRQQRRINTGLSTIGELAGPQLEFNRREWIVEMNEYYLKAATLPPSMRTLPDGRDVSKLTFEEWLQESVKTLQERLTELPRAVLLHGLKKQTAAAGVDICNVSIQAIQWFLALEPSARDAVLNETKLSNIEKDPRSTDEIVNRVVRDFGRLDRANQTTHPLRPSQMADLLREAKEKGGTL
jgi:hypothetical protein